MSSKNLPSSPDTRPAVNAKLIRRARWVVRLSLAFLVVYPAWLWLFSGPGSADSLDLFQNMSQVTRAMVWLVTLLPLAPIAFGLSQILRYCAELQSGNIFTAAAADCVRRLGWSLIVAAALTPARRAIVIALLPPHLNALLLKAMVSPSTVVVLLSLGLSILALASVLDEAARLAEENAKFI